MTFPPPRERKNRNQQDQRVKSCTCDASVAGGVECDPSKRRCRRRGQNIRSVVQAVVIEPLTAPMPVIRSQSAREVAEWFGLTAQLPSRRLRPSAPSWLPTILPRPGQITLLTGPSGAGKSTLLRHLRRRLRGRFFDLDRLPLASRPLTDCFAGLPLRSALGLLARVGLGEAWSYLRTPRELSEGQRWRLKLALALHQAPRKTLIADEFAAMLDRVTAQIVSRCFRKWVEAAGARAIVATSHTDLVGALAPDVLVTCDFTRVSIERRQLRGNPDGVEDGNGGCDGSPGF